MRLHVTNVPDAGGITVRLLGPVIGIHLHQRGKVASPCLGDALCGRETHGLRTLWRGYCAAEVWRDNPHRDWLPTVLTVSERLSWHFDGKVLRGSIWYLEKVKSDGKFREVTGHEVDRIPPSQLPLAFAVEDTVRRLYREPRIDFGRVPLVVGPSVVLPTAGYVPPTAEPAPLSPEEHAQAEEKRREEIKAAFAAARAAGGLRPFGTSTGGAK